MSEVKREIYSRFHALIRKVEVESPLLSNLGICYSFISKFCSLEIMQKYTIKNIENLFASYQEEKNEPIIFPKGVNRYFHESIAFFEAYLNAFYSLFQIIAKVTPYFYDQKAHKKRICDEYFDWQKEYFITNKDIDEDYAKYLKDSMTWYDDLVCNRHAVSHNVSAFLAFGEKEIEFIHMAKKRINYFENGKPIKKLLEYITTNWNLLFDFLNFYAQHFSTFQIFVDKEEETRKL